MSLNTHFKNIYCINLDRRLDRWLKFIDECKKYSIDNVTRISAVDGEKINNNTNLLNGELGILLTHYNIIENAKNKNLDSILIFEDDVIFTDEIKNINNIMSLIPNDWDFIYFGGNHVYGDKPIKINDKILKLNNTVALHCVAIKNTVFDEILELLPKKEIQVDGYYSRLHKKFNSYGVTPNIAKQREDFSDIQKRIVNYDSFFNQNY
jgi:GR25 family glycosyltransferase involved in LPS biosynthesis